MTVSRYEEVLARIDDFLADLDLLVRQAALQSIQLALSGEPAPASITTGIVIEAPSEAKTEVAAHERRQGAPRRTAELPAKASKAAKRSVAASAKGAARRTAPLAHRTSGRKVERAGGKRTPEQLRTLLDSTLKYIRRHPGSRMEQIAAGMGVPSKELNLPLHRLKSVGRLRVKGQKRATSYFAK